MNAADARKLGAYFDSQLSNQAELVAKQTHLLRQKRTGYVCDAQDAMTAAHRHSSLDSLAKLHIRVAIEHLDDALAAALILDPDEPAEQEAPLRGTLAAITAQTEQRLDGRRG